MPILKGESLEDAWVQHLRHLGFEAKGVPKFGEMDKAGIDILVYLDATNKWHPLQVKASEGGVRSHIRQGECRRFIPVVVGNPDDITCPDVIATLRTEGVWVAPHVPSADVIRREVAVATRGPWLVRA